MEAREQAPRILTTSPQVAEGDLEAMKNAIEVTLASFAKPAAAIRPKLSVPGVSEDRQELLHTLMDTYVKNDVLSIQQSIVNRECSRKGMRRFVVVGRCCPRGACNLPLPTCNGPLAATTDAHSQPLHAAATLLHATAHTFFPAAPRADVEYTMARSRYKFDDLEAYMATAYSVRDRLIEEWNDTQ